MTRTTFRPLAGALLACTLATGAALAALASAPAGAAPAGAYYRAELMSPLAEPRQEILNGVVWHCDGAECRGSRSGSRPEIVCGRLASKVGGIATFAVAGNAIDDEALARCNKA